MLDRTSKPQVNAVSGPDVIRTLRIDQTWLCNRPFQRYRCDHPSSTGSPTSSSINPNLLSPPVSTTVQPSALLPVDSHQKPANNCPPNTSNPASTYTKISGNRSYASETHDRDSANYRLSQETSGLFLGAMLSQKNLNRFLQTMPECPDSKEAFVGVSSAKKEVDMYHPFVSGTSSFCIYYASSIFDR
jgi:hypothetical protein